MSKKITHKYIKTTKYLQKELNKIQNVDNYLHNLSGE